METCKTCGDEKMDDQFYKLKKNGDKRGKTCKDCKRTEIREWRSANPEMVSKYNLWNKYRLRPDDYAAMLDRQNHACALCTEPFTKTPHVDHNHECCPGQKSCGNCVRGLLFRRCNIFLGYLELLDEPESVIAYMRRGVFAGQIPTA